nr:NIN-like protein [Tanacetum cinerariifolium]
KVVLQNPWRQLYLYDSYTKMETIGSENVIKDTIQITLQQFAPRDEQYLIQFWSPCKFGKHVLLKTIDEPFHFDIENDGLCNYRRESELIMFAVDDTCNEEDLNPVVRVFKRRLPEWTCNITKHGYLILPVFDSFTMLCVGVLDIVTTTKYTDFAYEVQQLHRILKETNLKSPQAFVGPISYVNEQDRITRILKDICDSHKLPFAQTWTVSLLTSFVVTGSNINKTCSSFSSSCIGKTSRSVVGRALSSHGSCFCGDVTKLNEEEYPLVHTARVADFTSCFAIYLRSIEHDAEYVLEFFLPVDMKESADLQNLVQYLKLHFTFSSGFELGDLFNTTFIGVSTEASTLSSAIQPHIIHTSLTAELVELDLLTEGETSTQIDVINAQDERDSGNDDYNFKASPIMENRISVEEGYGYVEKKLSVKSGRKRKLQSFTLETLQQYFRMPLGDASRSLGVSRSTLKRVCRDLGIHTWPLPHRKKKFAPFGIYTAALLLVRLKRWSCSSNHHGVSPTWWTCDKHKDLVSESKMSIEANDSIRVTSPLTIAEPACPTPSTSMPPQEQFGIYEAAFLLMGLKRWRKRSAVMRTLPHNDSLAIGMLSNTIDTFHAFSKQDVGRFLHTKKVTVKATFDHDTVKFQFPITSGLLQLKTQVAQRIRLESTRFDLKYRDEDDDLILIACDADLRNLMPLSATSGSNVTLKLFVEMVHNKKSNNGKPR